MGQREVGGARVSSEGGTFWTGGSACVPALGALHGRITHAKYRGRVASLTSCRHPYGLGLRGVDHFNVGASPVSPAHDSRGHDIP